MKKSFLTNIIALVFHNVTAVLFIRQKKIVIDPKGESTRPCPQPKITNSRKKSGPDLGGYKRRAQQLHPDNEHQNR